MTGDLSSKPTGVRKEDNMAMCTGGPRDISTTRTPLPTVILTNIQSLKNKIDELRENVENLTEYKSADLLAFTETWLKKKHSQYSLDIEGFGGPYRLDRDSEATGKSRGGGVCLYVKKNWCSPKNIEVEKELWTPDIELLSVSLCPFNSQREFPLLFVTLVYIHPKADVSEATQSMVETLRSLQKKKPDAPNFFMGDFNQCWLKESLGNFYQYVTFPTREGNHLDRCYGSVKEAYKSSRIEKLSDHEIVYLVPSEPKKSKSEDFVRSIQCLQEYLSCTDWNMLMNSHVDLDELTKTVCDRITSCKDKAFQQKSDSMYQNKWEEVDRMVIGKQSKRDHISLDGQSHVDHSDIVHIDRDRVLKLFQEVDENESPGADGIDGLILKNCAEQLAYIFSFIFKLSLQCQRVPCVWKNSTVEPVPKMNNPESQDEHRSVSLTSLVMKTFEKIVRDNLLDKVQANLDPLQFVHRGVDDVMCTLLHMILSHLEGANTFVRLVFINFSSPFNCIKQDILAERLRSVYSIDAGLIGWLVDFLTSTGLPQGCVLSPLLFALYTDECRSQNLRSHILKFTDNLVIVSLLRSDDSDHGSVVQKFTNWCRKCSLNTDVSKTKEMIIDLMTN